VPASPPRGLICHLEPDRERVTVRPVGELDLATVDLVEAPLGELWTSGFETIVVDLRWLSFMDSSGLRMILRWTQKARTDGTDLRVAIGDDGPVRRLVEITGLMAWLPIDEQATTPPVGAVPHR
jgi:anti-sigma B factor antagonist